MKVYYFESHGSYYFRTYFRDKVIISYSSTKKREGNKKKSSWSNLYYTFLTSEFYYWSENSYSKPTEDYFEVREKNIIDWINKNLENPGDIEKSLLLELKKLKDEYVRSKDL